MTMLSISFSCSFLDNFFRFLLCLIITQAPQRIIDIIMIVMDAKLADDTKTMIHVLLSTSELKRNIQTEI